MIAPELIELVRTHADAGRFQCIYQRGGPRRVGCAIAAAGPDLVILSVQREVRAPGDVHYFGFTETVATRFVSALAEPDPRITDGYAALRDHSLGLHEAAAEARLSPWADLNASLALSPSGGDDGVPIPALAAPVVELTGRASANRGSML